MQDAVTNQTSTYAGTTSECSLTSYNSCFGQSDVYNSSSEYSGLSRANYQNAQCPSLLGDYGMPSTDACMTTPWAWNSSVWGATAYRQAGRSAQFTIKSS
ncbi:MAG: hypothetical protein HRT35_20715 [Algicola sp.]|nr:hypothetical protein [Algicola sp.]